MTSAFAFTRSIARRRATSSCARTSSSRCSSSGVASRFATRVGAAPNSPCGTRAERWLGELAGGMHRTEILAPVGVDDDGGADRRRFVGLPEEELLSVSLERDFDQVGHVYSRN